MNRIRSLIIGRLISHEWAALDHAREQDQLVVVIKIIPYERIGLFHDHEQA
ncbi:MAG: hypothetical protein LBB61_09745 [Treponema sp.]|nr:hypothetical protein [Treponema sp.]